MIQYYPNGKVKSLNSPDLFIQNWGDGNPKVIFKRGNRGYRKEYNVAGELTLHLQIINSSKEVFLEIINGTADDNKRQRDT